MHYFIANIKMIYFSNYLGGGRPKPKKKSSRPRMGVGGHGGHVKNLLGKKGRRKKSVQIAYSSKNPPAQIQWEVDFSHFQLHSTKTGSLRAGTSLVPDHP